MAGIFIKKGMTVTVGDLVIAENEDGTTAARLTLHLGMDMAPHWLRLSLDHAKECEAAGERLIVVWPGGSNAEKVEALEREFRAGMQACVAAAISLDAFYGTVERYAALPSHVVDEWRRNRTARPVRIAETLRQTFDIPEPEFHRVRASLVSLFKLRDEAVHPTARPQATVPHPALGVGVERRLGAFHAKNAADAARTALSIMAFLVERPKAARSALGAYCQRMRGELAPLIATWLSPAAYPGRDAASK